ncbi:MAG: hypothetical protein AUG02_01490 [Chloroflexi bacterium 13_1_20CM_2_70_9]|nr:MAG: hypothetical protein AUG02_01490 [Chloroflexi bacterium 13_1_20CM_2_70_9]
MLQLSKSARKASASTVPGTVGRREYRRSTEVALRDPSNTAEGEPIGFVLGPRRFEHGITWARILGALVVFVLLPALPNLGPVAVAVLGGYLIVWAIALHVLSDRVRTVRDQDRLSRFAFAGDSVVLLIGLVTVSPDPRWAIYPLMGVLFIITAAFRLGWGGTLAATAILSLEIVGVAIWRDLALGLRVDTPYVAFDLLMYGLTALLTTAMLNELGALRRERTVLMARASDVEILRRAERERGELLDRERSARAEAELATARLEALQQVADAALSRARLDDVLPEILERVAQLFDADFAVVLQRAQAQGTYALRASSTRGQVPRTVVLLQSGDAERAITSRRPIAIADHSTREIDTILGAQVREAALAPLYAGGDLVGLLYVMRRQGRAFSADELGLLGLVGERVAAAVERGALLEAERRARAEAEAAEARIGHHAHRGPEARRPLCGRSPRKGRGPSPRRARRGRGRDGARQLGALEPHPSRSHARASGVGGHRRRKAHALGRARSRAHRQARVEPRAPADDARARRLLVDGRPPRRRRDPRRYGLRERAIPAALHRGRSRDRPAAREPRRERDRAVRPRVTGELKDVSGTRPGDTKEPL